MPNKWIRCLLSGLVLGYYLLPTVSVIAQEAPRVPGQSAPVSASGAYRLGPQDKLVIKVYEWRPSRDEIYEWPAFKAAHTVDATGALSLPLVGSVAAVGMTTTDLAREIGDRLQRRMGLIDVPDITIEVVQFRPFYIVGAVEHPGEFPYRPGLTVLKAYAIAGGKPRNALGLVRLEREAIATRGDIDAYDLEGQTLLVRLAFRRAEMADSSTITWPSDLRTRIDAAPLNRVVQQEQQVFDTRNKAFSTQLNALDQLETYLKQEVKSLEKQVELHAVEVASVKTEADLVSALYKKGLAVASRKLALDRNVAQVDGDRLRLELSLMRARQEVSKTKIAIIELKAKRSSSISSEMQAAQQRLEELRSRSDTAKRLLFETQNLAPGGLASQDKTQDMQPTFKIMRGERTLDGGAVADTTAIEPGDTIVVEPPTGQRMEQVLDAGPGTTSSASASDIAERLQ